MASSHRQPRLALWGILLVCGAITVYGAGVLLGALNLVLPFLHLRSMAEILVWWSGLPLLFGIGLGLLDLFVLYDGKRGKREVMFLPLSTNMVTVVLTAYNDELSIAGATRDFLAHPLVKRVIVVDNNSRDRTGEVALRAGAIVVHEELPGYGRCVFRALSEGLACEDTEVTLLCEGDLTFRAHDIEKFLAYIPHADIANGTRIVEQLREPVTQLSTFMYYGNFAVGKLLETKHLGRGTFTDVGTTYKMCRNSSLRRLLPSLNPEINLEFNAHFLDTALDTGERVVECPITFYPRVGESKGGNINNRRALSVGLRMLRGILLGWPERSESMTMGVPVRRAANE